jgi:hypothetical protein
MNQSKAAGVALQKAAAQTRKEIPHKSKEAKGS